MIHGELFVQVLHQPGEFHRRGTQTGSINWVMGSVARPSLGGRLVFRGMASVEPWTIRGCGYPSALATGETCEGDTIHDRQHPHEAFMEVAAEYARPLARGLQWQMYGGPVGEPALGPTAFPHRPSAAGNPLAPIAHHWLDATHIAFGVVTTGIRGSHWKAEASAFNGREPDEDRADFDVGALDSFSGRFSWAQDERLTWQISAGRLREAEAGVGTQPRATVVRATTSAAYHRTLAGGIWATTLAYGMNSHHATLPDGRVYQRTHAGLLESAWATRTQTWFARGELVGKPAHDLHAHEYGGTVFTVGKLQAGYVRHLRRWRGLVPGIGATLTASLLPPALTPHYGGRVVPGIGLFAVIVPSDGP
jgi:hypothetical protein